MAGKGQRIDGYLVVGGLYHDLDFARLELLKLLNEDERLRIRVGEDYRDTDTIGKADFLVTFTVDVLPTPEQQAFLRDYVAGGGRWFALHGTNSIIEWTPEGKVNAPRSAPEFMRLLGSQFIAHPPIMEFEVKPSAADHPLVQGIDAFKTSDELYLSELHEPDEVLLHCHYNGKAQQGFVEEDWFSDEPRPVMYLKRTGEGEVLYLTLGHCRGKWDMQPLMEEYPQIERCSWNTPEYRELLRRGIRWAARLDERKAA
ncbi:MAG: ThuA domain-containing protein [Gammaproteobacteria bacterium]|nr:MAG: ThuA domain-containing protein [Gammaproteobacteria bacterium]